eukprot:111754_1
MTSFLIAFIQIVNYVASVTLFHETYDSSPINTNNFWTVTKGSIKYEWYECPNGSNDGCMVLDGYGAKIYHQLSTVGKFDLWLYYDIKASTVNYNCNCTFTYMNNDDNIHHKIREWSGGSVWEPTLNNQFYFPPECFNVQDFRIYIQVGDTVGCTGNFCDCCFIDNFRMTYQTASPTNTPTEIPTPTPTYLPTNTPTQSPTNSPSFSPIESPTQSPTLPPSNAPSMSPTITPSNAPTVPPSNAPTHAPTRVPTFTPIKGPYQNYINERNISQSYYMYLFMSIFVVLVFIISLIGYYHNKFKSKE